MPIFEYRCTECESEFEQLVLKSSQPVQCPSCGGSGLEKKISLTSVSSETTRERATQSIRRKNRAIRKEYDTAEARRVEAHAKDHDD